MQPLQPYQSPPANAPQAPRHVAPPHSAPSALALINWPMVVLAVGVGALVVLSSIGLAWGLSQAPTPATARGPLPPPPPETPPVPPPDPPPGEPSPPLSPLPQRQPRETYGTSIGFFSTPELAAQEALKTHKLLLILHLSGAVEDNRFCASKVEHFRANTLASAQVGEYLNAHFVACFQKVATTRAEGADRTEGTLASYFCTPDGRVLHLLAGPATADVFLREAHWVVETCEQARKESRGDTNPLFRTAIQKAHADRLRKDHGLDVDRLKPRAGRKPLPQAARVHLLLTATPLVKLEKVYRLVFERFLGEPVAPSPVVTP